MAKNKVCVLGLRGIPDIQGGVESHCRNLYPRLVKLGWDVTVFCRKPYVTYSGTEFEGVHLKSLDCPRQKFLEAIMHTFFGIFAAKRAGCDIVHIHAIGPSICIPIARMMGMTVVMTHHGPDYDRQKWGRLAKAVLKAGERFGVRGASKAIVISKVIQDNVRRMYGVHAVLIPNGVNRVKAGDATELLAKYGLTPGKYILAVGRFVPEKGFHDLIAAFNEAAVPGMRLVIAGDADHEDDYSRSLKASAAANPDVVLTGFLKGPELNKLYAKAALFVLPSYHEGLPIVLLEAMSFGCLALCSDIPANKEVGMPAGQYFRTGSVDDLQGHLRQLIAAPMTAAQKDEISRAVLARYDWDKIARQTNDVYRGLMAS